MDLNDELLDALARVYARAAVDQFIAEQIAPICIDAPAPDAQETLLSQDDHRP